MVVSLTVALEDVLHKVEQRSKRSDSCLRKLQSQVTEKGRVADGCVHIRACLDQMSSGGERRIYISIESVPLAKLNVPCGAVEPNW